MARCKQGPRKSHRPTAPAAAVGYSNGAQDGSAIPRVILNDPPEGYSAITPDDGPRSMMPPARPDRQTSVQSDASEILARAFANTPFAQNVNVSRTSAATGPDFGGSILNKRSSSKSMERQRELINRVKSNSMSRAHEREARAMTMGPGENRTGRASSVATETPQSTAFTEALDAYASAEFTHSRPLLKYKRLTGTLTREEEIQWMKLEARRRARMENQDRSPSPPDDGEDAGNDPAAAVFSEIKRIFDARKRNNSATMDEHIQFIKVQAQEADRLRRPHGGASSRASTPVSNAGLFVNDTTRKRGFEDGVFGRTDRYSSRRQLPRKKFITREEARKKAQRLAKTGYLPNRFVPGAAPSKGLTDDGRGTHVEFGDYFLKATENDDRIDVIENYKVHVAEEVADIIRTNGVMPVYSGVPLKVRIRNIKKTWDLKTKDFCRRHGLEWSKEQRALDEEDKIFSAHKQRVYRQIRAGTLKLDSACFFAVELNIEMCRWRHKYHEATNTPNRPANLHELEGVEDLRLPTTEEFDTAYKPRYDKIIALVGPLFAESQDRVRLNHDHVFQAFPQVELPDTDPDSHSDEEEAAAGDDDDERQNAEIAAAEAARQAEKARHAREAREAAAEHETMWPTGGAATTE